MNAQSSRSHLVFSILVHNFVPATGASTSGKITFVDLAGSERVARSGAINDDQRLKEVCPHPLDLSVRGTWWAPHAHGRWKRPCLQTAHMTI
jgi:hypothetical protein